MEENQLANIVENSTSRPPYLNDTFAVQCHVCMNEGRSILMCVCMHVCM